MIYDSGSYISRVVNMGKSKVLVVDSGNRGHALVKMFGKSDVEVYVGGPSNPGILEDAQLAMIEGKVVNESDIPGLIDFCHKVEIDLVTAGSEDRFRDGFTDKFQTEGISVFGPNQKAAQYEIDKIWGKKIMKEAGIQTPDYELFTEPGAAISWLNEKYVELGVKDSEILYVVKHPRGDQGGKGILVPKNKANAIELIEAMFANKISGLSPTDKIMLEEFAGVGGKIFEEASCMVFTNGSQYVPLPFTQDHKKRFDGDIGPNTGGMGAYGPCLITKGQESWIYENIVEPSIKTMHKHEPMGGCLYSAIYRDTTAGHKPWGDFEKNVRFGDPELLPLALLLKSDNFYYLCKKCADREDISDIKLEWHPGVALTTVLANKEYPNKNDAYKANLGKPIYGLKNPIFNQPWCMLTHAATEYKDGQIVVAGGRTLGVTTLGKNIIEAHKLNQQALKEIRSDGLSWRNDIGYRDIQRLKAGSK